MTHLYVSKLLHGRAAGILFAWAEHGALFAQSQLVFQNYHADFVMHIKRAPVRLKLFAAV